VALHLDWNTEGPREGDGAVRVTDLGSEHRLVREGVEQLAQGALICPDCSAPVPLERPVGLASELGCAFCLASGPARRFLVRDVFDTPANEVYLVASLGG
jgi:hypothetical protein